MIDEDYNIQHKGAGEGVKVGLNQKTGEKRKSRYVMFTCMLDNLIKSYSKGKTWIEVG